MVRVTLAQALASRGDSSLFRSWNSTLINLAPTRMNRRKADFKFAYKFLEDDL